MALETTFGFTNTGSASNPISLKSNYALLLEDPGHVALENKTCPIDQPEQVTIRGMFTKNASSELSYKPKTSVAGPEAYSQFQVKLDDVATTRDTTTGEVVEENIVTAYLVVRVARSGNLSDSMVRTMVDRLHNITKTDDGGDRIPSLRRLALRPTED